MNLRTVKWAQWDKTQPRELRTAHLSVLMTVDNFSTQYSTEQFWKSPLLPPDNYHSSDVVYWRRRGCTGSSIWVVLLKAVDFLTDITGSRRTDIEDVCTVSSWQMQRRDSFHERLAVSACRQVCLSLCVMCYFGGIVERLVVTNVLVLELFNKLDHLSSHLHFAWFQ